MRWLVGKDFCYFILKELISTEAHFGYKLKIEWKFKKGWSSGGKGTCQGDSGGPLFYLNSSTNKYVLVGVTSFGSSSGCGLTGPQKYVTLFTCKLRIDCLNLINYKKKAALLEWAII